MTVSEAIVAWLRQFNPEEYWKMKQIDTELQSAVIDTYSLVKAPVQNVKMFLSGAKEFTDHYTFHARLASNSNADRIDNNGFGEALEGWVRERDSAEEYPDIQGATVQSIGITTPFYVGKTEDNSFIYQMTIEIKYEKEK